MTHKQPIKVFTSFSGYDSQCMALDRLGVDYDLVGWSEIDKYAIQAHDQLFPQFAGRNFGDICTIDWTAVPDFDLFTYSFPCTNISNAGLQEGFAEGSGTASSLLWECRKAISIKRPKYLLMENVKALVNKKNRPYFLKWQKEIESYGYTNFTQVLNAKDYGVAQNRERVFMISILGDDVQYNFPQKQLLTKCLADYLEDEVDEKYYLSEKMLAGFKVHAENKPSFPPAKYRSPDDIACTIRGGCAKMGMQDNYIKVKGYINQQSQASTVYGIDNISQTLTSGTHGYANGYIKIAGNLDINHDAVSRVYSDSGICPTIETAQGGGRQPKILQRGRGFNKGGSFDLCPTISKSAWEQNNVVSCAIRGRPTVGGGNAQQIEFNSSEFANAITTVQKNSMIATAYCIRRLTPRECFRLMDVLDSNFDKLTGISNTQLYKMAGNSIVTACLVEIFSNLLNQRQPITSPPVRDILPLQRSCKSLRQRRSPASSSTNI